LKRRHLSQPLVSSSTGNPQYVQRSQCKIKSSIQVQSLTEIHQRSTPPSGHLYVLVIWSSVSSLRSVGGTACSAGKYTSNCSNSTVMMPYLTQRCAIGAGISSWSGSMPKTQERLSDSPISVFSFEFTVHSRRCHGNSCNNRVLHFDKNTRPETPPLVKGTPLALRQSKK
jgi:hypothetical protein